LIPNPEEVFSSNRDGGQGYDDIYKFLETKKLVNNYLESDRHITSEILVGLKSFDNKFNPMGTVNTDDKGIYTLLLNAAKRIM
jgi:hypothetical protein